MKDTNFIALKDGVDNSQSTMVPGDKVEIQFNITAAPKDTKTNIEKRPRPGASYPLSKTTSSIINPNKLIFQFFHDECGR